jgi:hypothetical protein
MALLMRTALATPDEHDHDDAHRAREMRRGCRHLERPALMDTAFDRWVAEQLDRPTTTDRKDATDGQ